MPILLVGFRVRNSLIFHVEEKIRNNFAVFL